MRMHGRGLPAGGMVAGILLLVGGAAPAPAQEVELRWSGEVRLRTEAQRPARTGNGDAWTLLRTRLGVAVELGPEAGLFLQIQDGRVFGEETSTVDGSADAFDLHQGYARLEWAGESVRTRARAGRQELHLGSTRFVGAPQWGNAGRSFDALRVDVEGAEGGWTSTAFASTVQERGDRFGDGTASPGAPEGGDHTLFGAIGRMGAAEGFVFHDAGARYRSFRGVDRTTVGGRLVLPRFQVEGALQRGNHLATPPDGGDPVRETMEGWFLGGTLRLLGGGDAGGTRVQVGTEVYSGDDTPLDGKASAFYTLYPSTHDLSGLMDFFQDPAAVTRDGGLVDVFAKASLPLGRAGSAWPGPVSAEVHRFSLARSGGGDGDLGWELDVVAPLRLSPHARITLGYGAFRNGAGAPAIGFGPEGELSHWGFVQAVLGF